MKYRKKPIIIEAHQWDGTVEGATPIIDWILTNGGTARYHPAIPERPGCQRDLSQFAVPTHIAIDTLEGTMMTSPSDWIIRGVQGEFYPCKPDIFEAIYDAVVAEQETSNGHPTN